MPPGKLSLFQSTHSQIPGPPPILQCWPICKYSYSVTPISNRSQSPWLHFAQRDNIHLVLQTGQPGDVFDHSSSQTRMKIVWGAQTLEDIELTTLVQKTIPGGNFFQDPQPALMAIGRSPMLAIKYLDKENIRRFQIKFVLEDDYQSAVASLEKMNCLVKPPPTLQGVTEPASQAPPTQIVRPAFATTFNPIPDYDLSQRSPPRTPINSLSSSGSSDSTVTATSFGYPPMMPPEDVQQSQPFFGVEGKANPRTPIRREGFKPPSENPYTGSTNTYPSSPPELYHTPHTIQDLPPPRPPPNLGNREQLEISSRQVSSNGRSSLASVLPPLPRPTPIGTLRAASRAQTSAGYTSRPMLTPGSNRETFRQTLDEGQHSKQTIPTYINGLCWDMPKFPPDPNSKPENRLPLPFQPPNPEERGIHSHTSPSLSQPNDTPKRNDAPVGSKRGKKLDDNEDRNEHKQKKRQLIDIDEERAREEEDFAQMEEFIINAIHDDSFVRLVERIGGIWQRMGFEKAVPKLFTEE
ncbi:hypothetical protein L873DRAFT_1206933 [Choiromyces venosus 120613-1]|uniref:Uncharacterized protein n=1 Tax=Choiromyces venosus 120613-1 TaxID=1336337 RepID=A0A3N4JI45_9PEZI|nr:hypothetical protein L873DRAFT_1206933 [Choiromyces venosus 120613-1]